MSDEKMTHWKGRFLDEMSREELIEVAQALYKRVREYQTPQAITQRAIGKVELMKRGLS